MLRNNAYGYGNTQILEMLPREATTIPDLNITLTHKNIEAFIFLLKNENDPLKLSEALTLAAEKERIDFIKSALNEKVIMDKLPLDAQERAALASAVGRTSKNEIKIILRDKGPLALPLAINKRDIGEIENILKKITPEELNANSFYEPRTSDQTKYKIIDLLGDDVLKDPLIIAALINRGLNMNARRTREEDTLLERAAGLGYLETVKWLVNKGVKINDVGPRVSTPVSEAARKGKLDVLRFLYEQGGDIVKPLGKLSNSRVNFGRYKNTPLHIAAAMGHLEVVQFLVEHKADMTALNGEGKTPLAVAKSLAVIEFLKPKHPAEEK